MWALKCASSGEAGRPGRHSCRCLAQQRCHVCVRDSWERGGCSRQCPGSAASSSALLAPAPLPGGARGATGWEPWGGSHGVRTMGWEPWSGSQGSHRVGAMGWELQGGGSQCGVQGCPSLSRGSGGSTAPTATAAAPTFSPLQLCSNQGLCGFITRKVLHSHSPKQLLLIWAKP